MRWPNTCQILRVASGPWPAQSMLRSTIVTAPAGGRKRGAEMYRTSQGLGLCSFLFGVIHAASAAPLCPSGANASGHPGRSSVAGSGPGGWLAGPRVCNLEAICGAMVPIRKAKLAQIPFPTAWQEKPFATNQTMSPIFCLCFSVQTFVSRSEFGRGGGSNCFKRQSQDQMKAGQTHKWPGVLGARTQIMKVKKKLRAIKFTSAEYRQLCLPGNNF